MRRPFVKGVSRNNGIYYVCFYAINPLALDKDKQLFTQKREHITFLFQLYLDIFSSKITLSQDLLFLKLTAVKRQLHSVSDRIFGTSIMKYCGSC